VIYRLFRPTDVSQCIRLLPDSSGLSADVHAALPGIWLRLHLDDQLLCGVVVDDDLPDCQPIVAFGMSVFLNDGFVADYLATPRPYLARRVYEHILRGQPPVLSRRDVAAANSTCDLNMVILHFGMGPHVVDHNSRTLRILTAAQRGFRTAMMGFCLKRLLQEAFGDGQVPFFEAGGFLLKSDYGDWYARSGHGIPAAEFRPYLMGLYREDPKSRYPGTALSDLFQPVETRFAFSPAEQRVLFRAVMGETDEVIAEVLGVSRDAVKKVWRRVYNRVAAVDPEMLDNTSEEDQARGKEKRRTLVRYLQYHLAEIRPQLGRTNGHTDR
jgi:hypothetical protein